MNDIRRSFARYGLVRSRDERLLGGVASGLGRRLGLGPWVSRLLLVLLLLVIPGSQLLVYPILWILMPLEGTDAARVSTPTPGPTPAATPAA
jgi:phage shock protein C